MSRIQILFAVSALVVACAIGAAIFLGTRTRPSAPAEEVVPAAPMASAVEQPTLTSTLPTSQAQNQPDLPIVPPATAETGDPDAPPSSALEELLEPEALNLQAVADGQPAMVVTKDKDGKVTTRVSFRALMAHKSTIPVAAQVKAMPLSDAQRVAVEQFDAAFQPNIDIRLEQQAKAFQLVFDEMHHAVLSGDQARIELANQRLQQASADQATVVQQLNSDYLAGVRQYLTEEQLREAEKAVSRADGAWHSGGASLLRAPRLEQVPEKPLEQEMQAE